jgi:hypothetical protein
VKGEKVLCRSNDRKTPVVGPGLVPQDGGKGCEKCSKNSWKNYDRVKKTGTKPLCDTGYFIYFLDRKTNKPYIYTATRVSATACEAMKDAMRKTSKEEAAKTGYRPSTFEFAVKATTSKEGKNYQIKFESIARLKPEAAAEYKALYEAMLASRNQNNSEDEGTDGSTYYESGEDTGMVIEGDEPAAQI